MNCTWCGQSFQPHELDKCRVCRRPLCALCAFNGNAMDCPGCRPKIWTDFTVARDWAAQHLKGFPAWRVRIDGASRYIVERSPGRDPVTEAQFSQTI
mgnify:CR=1 FL=1